MVEQAIRDTELRRDLDVEVALDMLYGPLFFRLLMGHAPLDTRFAEALFAQVLRGMKR